MTQRFTRLVFFFFAASFGFQGCFLTDSSPPHEDSDDDNGGSGGGSGGKQSACFACGDALCTNEASLCDQTNGCRGVAACLLGCAANDGTCQLGCVPSGAEGSKAYTFGTAYYLCASGRCPQCAPGSGGASGGGGTGGATGGNGAEGGVVATGGSGNSSGVGATGGGGTGTGGATGGVGGSLPTGGTPPTGGTGTGGSAGATGGSGGGGPLTPGVHWLSFEGSWADPGVDPNGALNISGSLYSYSDSCAQVSWDAATRCVSGMLCEPGATYANWGMAVGFDFHNTGETGVPANTKLPWNATSVNALGVAWQISGSAPGLQVWITNMDPMWNGQCAADECAINGPPDGKPTTFTGTEDSLYLNNLVKDNWGGTGTIYTFNPGNILALQFKLAAVVSGPTPFSFCIDRIGIIL